MNTKEEIISKCAFDECGAIVDRPERFYLTAMDVFAQQEAIEFHVFVEKNYQPITASGLYMEQYKFEEGTPWPDLETIQKYSLPELYQLFIQSKQK